MGAAGRGVRIRGTGERILATPLAQRARTPRAFVDRGTSHRISVRRWSASGWTQIRAYQADRESHIAPDSSVPACRALRAPPTLAEVLAEGRALNNGSDELGILDRVIPYQWRPFTGAT